MLSENVGIFRKEVKLALELQMSDLSEDLGSAGTDERHVLRMVLCCRFEVTFKLEMRRQADHLRTGDAQPFDELLALLGFRVHAAFHPQRRRSSCQLRSVLTVVRRVRRGLRVHVKLVALSSQTRTPYNFFRQLKLKTTVFSIFSIRYSPPLFKKKVNLIYRSGHFSAKTDSSFECVECTIAMKNWLILESTNFYYQFRIILEAMLK